MTITGILPIPMDTTGANRRLEELVRNPMETLAVEYKEWIDPTSEESRAILARAVLALANFGGGQIVIGFTLKDGAYEALPAPEGVLEKYDHDLINSVANKYCDPAIHLGCEIVKSERQRHPIISVPGNHSVPIRCARDGPNMKHVLQNKYYIRRPGPSSEEIRTADEWRLLIRRCVLADKLQLIEDMRTVLNPETSVPAPKKDAVDPHKEWVTQSVKRMETIVKDAYGSLEKGPYAKGGWYGAYSFDPPISDVSAKELSERLRNCAGRETGWPIGQFPPRAGQPYLFEGALEMSLIEEFNDPLSGDYWRASPSGKFVIFRGMEEDSQDALWGGKYDKPSLNFTLPVWRLAELLLHAMRFGDQFSPAEKRSATVSTDWYGLKGRQLTANISRYGPLYDRHSKQDKVHSEIVIPDISRIQEQLPELIAQLTKPLYEVFDFFEMPMKTIQSEINALLRR